MKNNIHIQYNSIEFLRVIFTFAIIIFHIFGIIDPKANVFLYCRHSRIIVEFFFIISGFFLYSSYTKNVPIKTFIIKRLIRLYPILFVSVVFVAFYNHIPFWKTLPAITMLAHLGFKNTHQILGYCWYIYVLFWVSIFYYCLSYSIKDNIKLSFIISLLIYASIMILSNDNPRFVQTFKNFFTIFNGGVLRGIIGIGIGILIALHFTNIQTNINKYIFTVLEIFLLSYLLAQLFIIPAKNVVNYALVFIILFSILFICFINKLGYISIILDKFNICCISKYCYSLYVAQCISKEILPLNKLSNNEYIILSLLCTTTLGIAMYHLVEKPCAKYLSNKFFGNAKNLAPVERENNSLS